jgi:two-component system cell cycle response regulator DivK
VTPLGWWVFAELPIEEAYAPLYVSIKRSGALLFGGLVLAFLAGLFLARRIRADPALHATPIIVITSYALSGDEAKARGAGCDAYVSKPYSPRQLLAKIREYLPTD